MEDLGLYTFGPRIAGQATPKVDIAILQSKLNENYKLWKPIAIADSALFIKAIVNKEGALGTLEIESGSESDFTKKVLEFIRSEVPSWWPANTGRRVMYQATFFVRLNKDDSITFSVL